MWQLCIWNDFGTEYKSGKHSGSNTEQLAELKSVVPDSLTREEGFVVPLFKQPTMPLVSVGRTPLLSRTTPFFFAFYVINQAHRPPNYTTHTSSTPALGPVIMYVGHMTVFIGKYSSFQQASGTLRFLVTWLGCHVGMAESATKISNVWRHQVALTPLPQHLLPFAELLRPHAFLGLFSKTIVAHWIFFRLTYYKD